MSFSRLLADAEPDKAARAAVRMAHAIVDRPSVSAKERAYAQQLIDLGPEEVANRLRAARTRNLAGRPRRAGAAQTAPVTTPVAPTTQAGDVAVVLEPEGGSRLGERHTLVIGDVPAADIVIHCSAGATEIHSDDEQHRIVLEGNAVLRLKSVDDT